MNQGISTSSNELQKMTSSLFPQHISPNMQTPQLLQGGVDAISRDAAISACAATFLWAEAVNLLTSNGRRSLPGIFHAEIKLLAGWWNEWVRDVVSSFDCLSYCLRPLKSFGAGFKASTCMVGWMWFWDARTFQIMQKLSAWSTALTCFHIFVVDISVDKHGS